MLTAPSAPSCPPLEGLPSADPAASPSAPDGTGLGPFGGGDTAVAGRTALAAVPAVAALVHPVLTGVDRVAPAAASTRTGSPRPGRTRHGDLWRMRNATSTSWPLGGIRLWPFCPAWAFSPGVGDVEVPRAARVWLWAVADGVLAAWRGHVGAKPPFSLQGVRMNDRAPGLASNELPRSDARLRGSSPGVHCRLDTVADEGRQSGGAGQEVAQGGDFACAFGLSGAA